MAPVRPDLGSEAKAKTLHEEQDTKLDSTTQSNTASESSTSTGRHVAAAMAAPDHNHTDTKFALSTTQLNDLSVARTLDALNAFGGISGLAAGLRTDLKAGLSVDEDRLDDLDLTSQTQHGHHHNNSTTHRPKLPKGEESFIGDLLRVPDLLHHEKPRGHTDRRRVFGENRLPKPKSKTFWQLAWLAFNDRLIFLLLTSATISLALGIYEAVAAASGDDPGDGSNLEWVESVTILAAVFVIVFASATNDYHKNYRFQKLNAKTKEGWVTVVRSGRAQRLSIFDVLVGDILRVEAGDVLHADGVLVQGSAVQCDEASMTGEAGLVHKSPAAVGGKGSGLEKSGKVDDSVLSDSDVFVFSGTKVVHGIGSVLVTAVGSQSANGRIQLSLRSAVEQTPLQIKLGRLAKYIIIVGFVVGTLFFLAQFIRWCIRLPYFVGEPEDKGESFLKIFMLAVTVVVIGVPEGLSLAVAVALAFGTSRMLKEKNLVRLLRSCEVMGNATTICSDKTGTLTQGRMTVVAGVVGGDEFGADDDDEGDGEGEVANGGGEKRPVKGLQECVKSLDQGVRRLLRDMVVINTTAFEQSEADREAESAEDIFVGSGTETALLRFGRDHLGMGPVAEERENADIVEMLPFSAVRKWMAVVVRLPGQEDKYRLLVKGAAEIILDRCSEVLDKPTEGLIGKKLEEEGRHHMSRLTKKYAERQLRPIALAYKDFEGWPPRGTTGSESDSDHLDNVFESAANDLTFIGTLGIQDPLRPEVIDAVRQCQNAGVFVRMVTGDNIDTAKSIAHECGIYTAGGIALDGPTFRMLTEAERDVVVPRLQVLARSSPDDKEVLVRHLRKMGETVAVTGDGTNDAFALKAADVGFAMGVSGTDVAKEACAIVLMDDNFASIVSALAWGRVINDSAKKFCQFQFTINITAGLLTIVTTLVESVDAAVFAVIQLLWLNLIMDIFAALALATDFPTKTLLQRRPESRNASIITPTMWKMVLGQAVFQLTVIFTLHYIGQEYFVGTSSDSGVDTARQMQTFVFNIYMFMQVFNQTNCRRTDNKLNVFEGIHRNLWFLMVQAFTIGGQVAIVMAGGPAFQTEPLTAAQWGWTMLFGLLTFPVGALLRLIPDRIVIRFASKYLKPLAWPVIKTVRWFRQRKLVKVLEQEVKEATEATAAAERARRASTAQAGGAVVVEDDDDELDEERRVRRMRWRRGKHYRDRVQALQQQIEKHRALRHAPPPTAAETSTSVIPGPSVAGIRSSTDDAVTVESGGQVSHTSLLERLPERLVRGSGKAAEVAGGGFYVHPDTPASDPVLVVREETSTRTCAPSQDPELLGHMGFYKRK